MDVFLIRLKDNNELIGYVEGIHEDKVKTLHLHYIKYFSDSHSLGIMPYCPLSDEVHFDIDISRVEFMVLPSKIVKKKYIDMLKEDCEECTFSNTKKTIDKKMFVEGNETKH
jgi:hypothetical protein